MSNSNKGDYIPKNVDEFKNFTNGIIEYTKERINGEPADWPEVSFDRVAELDEEYNKWLPLYEAAVGSQDRVLITARNDGRKPLEKCLRAFIQDFLYRSPVTPAQRVAMNLQEHDTTRTPHIEVHELVEFEIDLRGIREILVDFWVKNSSGKAKPQGYDGAVVIWAALAKPPASVDELTHHAMASRTPHALKFTEADRGKTIYIAMAWQNARGNLGDWSEIQHAIIP